MTITVIAVIGVMASSSSASRAAAPTAGPSAAALERPFAEENARGRDRPGRGAAGVGGHGGGDDADADADAAEPANLTDDDPGRPEADVPGAALRTLACLEGEGGNDEDGARRGVQKRDFSKRHRLELSLLGGHYAADALSSTYVAGAALAAFLSEDFGVEVLLLRHPVQLRLEQPFSSFDRERHFQNETAWVGLAAMTFSPIHGKLRWSERHITHFDLSFVAGAGRTFSETAQGLTYQMGFDAKLFLGRFVSLRFDVRDLLVAEEVLGRGRVGHDIVTLLGLSGWFPG